MVRFARWREAMGGGVGVLHPSRKIVSGSVPALGERCKGLCPLFNNVIALFYGLKSFYRIKIPSVGIYIKKNLPLSVYVKRI